MTIRQNDHGSIDRRNQFWTFRCIGQIGDPARAAPGPGNSVMQIIDRYLTRQYFRVFVITYISLLGVYIVGEFVTNFSEFMEYREVTPNFGRSLAAYYAARISSFFDLAGHIIALLAAVLVVSWMQGSNELTALQAAGVGRMRIMRSLFTAAVVIAILAALNRELVIPRLRHLLLHDVRDIVSPEGERLTPHYDNTTDILIDGQSVMIDGTLVKPRIGLPFIWNRVGHNLRAATAVFQQASASHPAGYLLDDTSPSLEEATSVFSLDGDPMLLAPSDTAWLQPGQCFVVSQLRPQQLNSNHRWLLYSSTAELAESMRDQSTFHSATTEIAMHSRFVKPFLDLSLVLLGLPTAFVSRQRRVVSNAAKSLGMVALFSTVVLGCHAAGGQALLRPVMAAWLPLLILGPTAVLLSGPLSR